MVADLAAVYHYLVERLWDQSKHHTRMSEYLVAKAGSLLEKRQLESCSNRGALSGKHKCPRNGYF